MMIPQVSYIGRQDRAGAETVDGAGVNVLVVETLISEPEDIEGAVVPGRDLLVRVRYIPCEAVASKR